jgi:putative DNA methylase
MTQPYKKKLIEVALPLDAINVAASKEKSSPFLKGHSRSLHQWWARRPVTAARAIIFAQMIDDPSEHPDKFPSESDVQKERERLFRIIESLCAWESQSDAMVLKSAREEMEKCCGGHLPPFHDPFSGGGALPIEAQRLGLKTYGSDLNPVAVMIGKAMFEIPPRFVNKPPVHPAPRDRSFYQGSDGLAEDIRYYAEKVQKVAYSRVAKYFDSDHLQKSAQPVLGWIWVRTVPSPDPAFSDAPVPIASSFVLSQKKGQEVIVEPVVDIQGKRITFRVNRKPSKAEIEKAKAGTKAGRGANFVCLLSGAAITPQYVKACSQSKRLGAKIMAIVTKSGRTKSYSSPSQQDEDLAHSVPPRARPTLELPTHPQYVGVGGYGFREFGELFTDRQILVLDEFCTAIAEVHQAIEEDAVRSFGKSDATPLREGGSGSAAYADAVRTYLSFCLDKIADYGSTLCGWNPINQNVRQLFSRQAISMTWDFVEINPFSEMISFSGMSSSIASGLEGMNFAGDGECFQSDAAKPEKVISGALISTDPPYYDNVPYADISDFFYIWLRRNLKDTYPALFSTISVPKSDELVADRVRHGGASEADAFFLRGMKSAMARLASTSSKEFPATIYYAFKQSEIESEGVSSTGWATFLDAVISAGYSIVATWPVRTEREVRTRAIGSNALASSVVLVCRQRAEAETSITRSEFLRFLRSELPSAISKLQAANLSPADMPQAAIGPGMGVFSRYTAVLEADDSPMTVKTALQLINAELDEYLGGIQGEFDADTRFAITWFEQNGMGKGDFGAADSLARARGISVDSAKHAGIVESAAGKVRLLKRDELDPDWAPEEDGHLTVWECLQHLVRLHEKEGLSHDTAALLKRFGPQAEAVKDLAYCLYDIAANKRREASEATVYNALIADWSEMSQMAATVSLEGRNRQARFEL